MSDKKPLKPINKNTCFMDEDNRIIISYDPLQWIINIRGTNFYYQTAGMLLDRLFEFKLRDYTKNDLSNLSRAFESAKSDIFKVAEAIKLPKYKLGE